MKHLLFLGIVFSVFQISHSSTPEFCRLPPDEGQGMNFNFAVYYDFNRDQCSPFIYKGEGGNANRFQSEKDCLRNCSANSENVYPMNATKACLFPNEKGGCNGQNLRYYYDPAIRKCKKFLWTGCLGNGNRFFDYLSCNATCFGIRDESQEQQEEDEPDTPIAIICGVLLAVIIVAVIITVTVLTVMSKKKSAKKKGAGKSKDPQTEAPLQDRGIEMD